MKRLIALLIDDEEFPRKAVARILLESGFFLKVHEYENLRTALTFLKLTKQHVHFVFCDVLLREERGTKAVDLLQPFVDCVILFTGSVNYKDREDANNSVPHGILYKPINPDLLNKMMHNLLYPADPLKKLQPPQVIWTKPLDSQASKKPIEIKVLFMDIAYFQKHKSYSHIYVVQSTGKPKVVGRVKQTIRNVYKRYELSNTLLYANSSQLVHTAHITHHTRKIVNVSGKVIPISALGRSYYEEYLRENSLLQDD